MDKIKVIHLGVGGRGVWPLRCFKERTDFVSVAYVDTSETALQKACSIAELPVDRCFRDFKEALEKVSADAVFIITPPQLHAQQCMQAIAAGKHVLVEKPFTLSLKEAREIVAAAEKKDLKVQVAQNVRYKPIFITLANLLKSKIYGEVSFGFQIKVSWRPGVHHSGQMKHSYLWERGVHDFDTLLSLIDSPVRKVFGRSFNPLWSPYQHGAGICAVIEFENGLVFNSFCTFSGHQAREEFLLELEKGTIEVVGSEIRFWNSGSDEYQVIPQESVIEAEQALLDAFYAYVTQGKEPPISGRQNLKTIGLIESCGVSSDQGKVIELTEYLQS